MKTQTTRIDSEELTKLLKIPMTCISKDETRYTYNGSLIEADVHGLRAISTDGHRLMMVELPNRTKFRLPKDTIIHRDSIRDLLKTFKKSDYVDIESKENSLKFTNGNGEFNAGLIEGTFPKYNQCIPDTNGYVIKIEKSVLHDALKNFQEQAKALDLPWKRDGHARRQSDQNPIVVFNGEEGKLKLEIFNSDYQDIESIEVETDVCGWSGKIGLSLKYLLDFVKVVPNEVLVIGLKDPVSPARIDFLDWQGTLVLMPVRIS